MSELGSGHVSGETLEQYMQRRTAQTVDQAIDTMTEAAQGQFHRINILLRLKSEISQRWAAELRRRLDADEKEHGGGE